MPDRRTVVAALAALPLTRRLSLAPLVRAHGDAEHVAVVGAGAFGGWTAWHLLQAGMRVTLLDAYGAGNARAASGGETRLIRAVYGGQADYIAMVTRAFQLWREAEARWRQPFFQPMGALWMFDGPDDAYARTSVAPMRAHGFALEELSAAEAARRFPQIRFNGVRHVWWEPGAGTLLARASCEAVRAGVVAAGGEFRLASARVGQTSGRAVTNLLLSDGTRLAVDRVVFACGPWLGRLFPDVVGRRIRATRQDILFFGTPAGDARFLPPAMPAWANFGERLLYGMPDNQARGFKVGDDTVGEDIDPDRLERVVSPRAIALARALLRRRFPALANAPVVETRVCQYEPSTDHDFVLDRHPGYDNVWLAGGGSGHGFKVGPAIGEMMAKLVLGTTTVTPRFALARPSLAPPPARARRVR